MEVNFERFTNFNRTRHELEHLLFFSIAVAGKNASIVSRAVNRLFKDYDFSNTGHSPYFVLSCWKEAGVLREKLQEARLGKYDAITKSAERIIQTRLHKRLDTCTLRELIEVPYCGLKTARMILLHSRPKQRMIPLDTHILKFMREELKYDNVPKATPGSKVNETPYILWETYFLEWIARCESEGTPGFTVHGKYIPFTYYDDGSIRICDVDLQIWLAYRVDTKARS